MLTRKEMIGPWAGLPVAWKDNGRTFDEDAYRANIDRCCKAGVPGVYTAGTTGEFYAMEFDEWQAVTRATVEQCKQHGTPAMIGVTSTYTLGVQRRTAFAAELGADAIQLAVPFWMEVDDREIVPFFKEVVAAAPGLALTIYDTLRSRKKLTVDMHRAIFDATGTYLAVKANSGTVGRSEAGCTALSEFINVWVSESDWATYGPHGAIGCASALVYVNPRYILRMFDLLQSKEWGELTTCCELLQRHDDEGLAPFAARGFSDSAYDHLQGLVTGFLEMSPLSRGPYVSCTGDDVEALRVWMAQNVPELLEL
jgi:dihydrodipicolinate synthase/N-acetylneuraminate lyase